MSATRIGGSVGEAGLVSSRMRSSRPSFEAIALTRSPSRTGHPEAMFTGPVVVWDREGNVHDERLISCPGAEVVVTLTR